MGDVADLVREEAPPVTIPSDDLIQGDCGYGGLSEDGRFEFVFFPEDGGSWTIKLAAADIEEIADGRLREVAFTVVGKDPWMITDLSVPEAIQKLASIGVEGLSATSTRSEIIAKLGPPQKQGGPPQLFEGKLIDPWIKYLLPQCQVHFTFNAKETVRYIQFLPADWSPGA